MLLTASFSDKCLLYSSGPPTGGIISNEETDLEADFFKGYVSTDFHPSFFLTICKVFHFNCHEFLKLNNMFTTGRVFFLSMLLMIFFHSQIQILVKCLAQGERYTESTICSRSDGLQCFVQYVIKHKKRQHHYTILKCECLQGAHNPRRPGTILGSADTAVRANTHLVPRSSLYFRG